MRPVSLLRFTLNIMAGLPALVLLALLSGCQPKQSNQQAVVEGTIEFPSSNKIYLYSYADSIDLYLSHMTILDSSLIDKNGRYSFSIHVNSSLLFNLESGNDNLATNLFISPGDQIILNFTGKQHQPEIVPGTNEAKYNSYLIQFLDSFYKDPLTKQNYYIVSNYMDLAQFSSYNEERKQKQLAFFDSFFKRDSLKKEFKDHALNSIYYGIAVDRLVYLWKKRMKGENVKADSSFLRFETPAFIENEDALQSPSYIRFLNLYIKDEFERMVERGELPVDRSGKLIPPVEKYKLAIRLLHKRYSDIVLYNILADDMHDVASSTSQRFSKNISLDILLMNFKKKYNLQ